MSSDGTIAVAGAGSIGCFVGGMLAASGQNVALLARPRLISEIQNHDLRLTSFDGAARRIGPDQLRLSDDPALLGNARIVLVTVKSADTVEIADAIARHAPEHAVIVSLQNGVSNVPVLREYLPNRPVLGGMVPFNVVRIGKGRFHRSTSGEIYIEQDDAKTASQLSVLGLKVRATRRIVDMQWGKLLLNLNNALNALADLPLRAQLGQRKWRTLFADQIAEALTAMKAAGVRPVSSTPIPPHLMPLLLRMPDWMFEILLGRTMKIDPEARSSMSDDLMQRRRTEIDYLQGAIIAIAERHGVEVPLTRRIAALVKQAEASGKGSPHLRPEQIRAR
jgi:2-dehydropantoate 2-reductase